MPIREMLLYSLLMGSSVADLETTYHKYSGEANPIMRPFVESGRPASYALKMGVNSGLIYAAHELKKRKVKYWWLAPVIAAAAQGAAAAYNMKTES